MYSVNSNTGTMCFNALLAVSVLTSCVHLFQGASAANNTLETDAEQPYINNTEVVPDNETIPENGEPEPIETGGETNVTEAEATEAFETEVDTTESETLTPKPSLNVTRTQALKKWGAHILASKYMGSLAVLYLSLCLFLALKQGPMFVR